MFHALTNRLRDLVGLAETVSDLALAVANDDNGAKAKATAAFDDFGNPVDENNFLYELLSSDTLGTFEIRQGTPPYYYR